MTTNKNELKAKWLNFWGRFKPFKFSIGDGYDYHCFVSSLNSENDCFSCTIYKFGGDLLAPEYECGAVYKTDTLLSRDTDGNFFIDDTKKKKFIEGLIPRIEKYKETLKFIANNDPIFWCCAGGDVNQILRKTSSDFLNSPVSIVLVTMSPLVNLFLNDFHEHSMGNASLNDNKMNIINTVMEYLKSEVDMDFRYSYLISKEQVYIPDFRFPIEDNEKYDLIVSGPVVTVTDKDGTKRTVEPRKEFLRTYPLVVKTNSIGYLKELMKKVDALEPVGQLHLGYQNIDTDTNIERIALTKAKQKYIVGKIITNDFMYIDNLVTLINYMNIDALPELPDNPFFSNDEATAMDRCVSLITEFYKDRNMLLGPLNSLVLLGNKTISSFLSPNEKFTVLYERILKETKTDSKKIDFRYIVNDIKDSIKVFLHKVVFPSRVVNGNIDINTNMTRDILEYNGFTRANDRNNELKFMYIFAHSGLINLIKMSKRVHQFPNLFAYACNDDTGVAKYVAKKNDNMERFEFLEAQNELIKDDAMREKAGLGYKTDWVLWVDRGVNINGYNFIPLASKAELDEEGDKMKNCVGWGGYAKMSMKGSCKIFTVRDKDFNRVATLSVKLIDNKNNPIVEELRGYNNSDVAYEIDEATEEFTKYLQQKVLIFSGKMAEVQEEIKNPPKEDNSIPSLCGYVPDSEEKVLEAMKHWNEFLPREYRNNLKKLAEL